MLATLFNMPKWLVALVALCVLAGYSEQVKCKIGGCKPTTAVAKADTAKGHGKPAPSHGEQDCQCQCHFTTLVPGEAPVSYGSFIQVVATNLPTWVGSAPEAPCLDIEHPPQLA